MVIIKLVQWPNNIKTLSYLLHDSFDFSFMVTCITIVISLTTAIQSRNKGKDANLQFFMTIFFLLRRKIFLRNFHSLFSLVINRLFAHLQNTGEKWDCLRANIPCQPIKILFWKKKVVDNQQWLSLINVNYNILFLYMLFSPAIKNKWCMNTYINGFMNKRY